jgi:predicted ArsR family transcriptional regulator
MMKDNNSFASSPIALDRDVFFRSVIRELTGTLQNLVGLEEASGFVSIVGQQLGEAIGGHYQAVCGGRLDREQVAAALVDLKRRIGGDFFVIEQTEDKIVLGNRRCPFGEKVLGRPSICMMTSNMVGSITADNLGFAKVELRETIAKGGAGCVVVIHLKQTTEAALAEGREYVTA